LILVDTSAWIEFLQDTGSPVCERVDGLLASKIATCDAIRVEVLAGARDDAHARQLARLLERATLLPTESVDFEAAATIYRRCRAEGRTVRKLIDCLIAAVAIRASAALLHRDADFTAIAAATELSIDATA
jgi:predicted nucleic acid-binding protein